jgi:hypothetical protein
MHRMRLSAVWKRTRGALLVLGLSLLTSTALTGTASADLIMPIATRAYPDISADVNGVVTYTYNSSTQTGDFHVTNTPYLLAGGPTPASEFNVTPDLHRPALARHADRLRLKVHSADRQSGLGHLRHEHQAHRRRSGLRIRPRCLHVDPA